MRLYAAMSSLPGASRARVDAIDVLRGLVMVIMVLDHTRDFVHVGAFGFDPTDLTNTTTTLFLTRWITHYCAPIFVFLAGLGAYLQRLRGKSASTLAGFLVTRGAWLIVLECTVVRVGSFFNVDYTFLSVLQVMWALGVSMIVLSGLVYLPFRAIAAFGLIVVAGHNLLDGIRVASWQGPGFPAPPFSAKLWMILHQPWEFFPVFGNSGPVVAVVYPLLPWIGVMALGYVAGSVYEGDSRQRRTRLYRWGAGLLVAFLVLRGGNIYGDPSPWAMQKTMVFTWLSFVNVTKYPVSLLYLLMTIGPALLALAWLESRERGRVARVLMTFGRVPLFFYLLQWPVAHTIAVVLGYAAGKPISHLFLSPPAMFAPEPGSGFGLPVVYACWIAAVAFLFPLCVWFDGIKQRHHHPLLSYL